jgi:hypothetical protein
MQTLDQDYRGRLQDWTNRRFQVDAVNNQTVNREIDQEIDAENAMARVQLQGENARQLAAQRAQDALNQLMAKSEAEQIKEMESLGINPYSENAYGEYLAKRGQMANAELKYTQARTNWNNRIASGSGRAGAGKQTYDLPTLQRGRQTLLSKYDQQIQALNGRLTGNPMTDNAIMEQIKQLQTEKKRYYDYNPGSNELLDQEVMDAAYQMEEDGINDNGSTYEVNQIIDNPQPEEPFQWQSPNSRPRVDGSKLTEQQKISAMNQNRVEVLRNAPKIAAFDINNPDPETSEIIIGLAQELLDLGVTEDPDEAVNAVLRIAKQNAKK